MANSRTDCEFKPDIVVEVTMRCDMRCKGCYAPILFQPRDQKQISGADLSLENLRASMMHIMCSYEKPHVGAIAVRGGEPSLHPNLDEILISLRSSTERLYLETNGNWILNKNVALLHCCARLHTIVKISFDSMHETAASALCKMCETLDAFGISWIIAITERNEAEFEVTRHRCSWIPAEKIIFQQKAFHKDYLMEPGIGVIHQNGKISGQMTLKPGFSKVKSM